MWHIDTSNGGELVGGFLVACAPHPGLYDPCGWLAVCFVEAVTGCECVEGALFADWAVGAGFDCVDGVGVYWLGVGEDWVAVAGWFSLLHTVLLYTTFVALGNIDSEPHACRFALHGGVDGGDSFCYVLGRIIRHHPCIHYAVH